jgi:phosphatidylinositol alpha-1,6-mannosyltransferase
MSATATDTPRLLLLSSEFPPGPGGIGTHAYQLARQLTARGWAVTVVTAQEYAPAAARAAFNSRQPFAVVPLPGRAGGHATTIAARLRAIGQAMRAARPDLLLATGRRALWLAAVLGPICRLPVVAVGHGSEFHSDSAVARAMTGRAIAGAAAVVAVSDYTAGLVRAAGRPRRLLVIPNAADGDRFGPTSAPLLPRSPALLPLPGAPVLLTVGRVGDRKAQDVVIRALPRVLAVHPDVVYVMAGIPEKQAAFTALAEELGVAHAVRFTGAVDDDDLPALYNRADLFVLVSRRTAGGDVEGYGIVVQEAALCGVPAVVSRGCGLTEAIREGETGVSVPPDDPEATAAAIVALLDDGDARARMGRRARELAARATWADRVADYDRLFREVLAAAGRLMPDAAVSELVTRHS